jgi:hypothetical protein
MTSRDEDNTAKLPVPAETVDGELYEELLNRYERMLVFAGGLQEKLKSQKLLVAKNEDLADENDRLRRIVSAGDAYIKVLEQSLRAIGLPEGNCDGGNRVSEVAAKEPKS